MEETITSVKSELPENIIGTVRDGDTVKTAGGTWKAKRYAAVKRLAHAPAWGASMNLEFTPEHPANATKIVLVQSVTAMKNQRLFYQGSETTEARSVNGMSIDQVSRSRSPLYADDPDRATGALGETPVQENAGEHGYRYQEKSTWKVKPAWLRDVPHLRDVTTFSSQVFETTALAVEGEDKGKYYGSVGWGWYAQDDEIHLYKLSVESQGSVTKAFLDSAKQWNKTRTSEGETPQKLPESG